ERFEAPTERPKRRQKRRGAAATDDGPLTLRDWRSSVIIGTTEGCEALRARPVRAPWWRRAGRLLRGRRR
ncbi:MAG: hypothetical protein CVU47_04650, partial [Chloroflexi bacterium HGW-Chloroflexi-9]